MAFSSSLTIADEANAAKTFVEIERAGTKATRIDNASTLSLPKKLVISHQRQGSGPTAVDRHLVQFTKMNESTDGVQVPVIVNLTISVPLFATAGDADELVGHLINFIIGTDAARTLANLDNILLGES